MTKIEELKAAFEAATMQCPPTPDDIEGRLTHDNMEDRQLPCTVFSANVYTDDLDDMHVSEVTVLEYRIAEGASIPTLLVRYPNGSRAQTSVDNFHMTRESAQAEVDAVDCIVRRDSAWLDFVALAPGMMPQLLEAAEMLSRARNLIAEAVNMHIYNIEDGETPDADCQYMAFLKDAKRLMGELK